MTHRIEIGLALWSMRTSVQAMSSWPQHYQDLLDDARLAESLGFDSLWIAEHHFWYDGWCPQPLVAAAAALGATSRLRVGTAMHLLPQHDPQRVINEIRTLRDLHGPRLDFGASLGYRDEEYDGVGVPRTERGRRMSHHLDQLLDSFDDEPLPVYIGGLADAAVRRAGRRGLGLLLPNTLKDNEVARRAEAAASEAASHGLATGRTGMLIDTWIAESAAAAEAARGTVAQHYREYTGAWYRTDGQPMHTRPDLLNRQSARTRAAAAIGSPGDIVDRLQQLASLGVNTFVLQVIGDRTPEEYRTMMRSLAEDVLPHLQATVPRSVV